MAKGGGQPYFGSQFFINLKDNPALDFDTRSGDRFYPFGRVIEGMDIVNSLVKGDVMESVTITRTLPIPTPPPPRQKPRLGMAKKIPGKLKRTPARTRCATAHSARRR